jgi:hypothetical protein
MSRLHAYSAVCVAVFTPILSLSTAGAQRVSSADSVRGPVPQQAVINTSRSNIKGNARSGAPSDPVIVEIRGQTRSGVRVSLTDTTDEQGQFSFGTLPEGRYTLTVRAPAGDASRPAADADTATVVGVSLQGTAGGTVERVVGIDRSAAGGPAMQAPLTRPGGSTDTNGRRGAAAAQPEHPSIEFTTNGRSEVKGTARHDTAMNAIGNIRG